jgi:tetratricopeptide (TPR) repeat protein
MRWHPFCGLLPLLAALGPLGCESGRSYRVNIETPLGVAWIGKPITAGDVDKVGGGDELAARACVGKAEWLARAGQAAQAIAEYEKAREIDPGVKVARPLAALYERQGKPELALAELRRALREGGRGEALFNDLGYCYYRQGDCREAESWLRQAVAVNPACDRAWVNLGLVLGKEGRYEESCDAFARAVRPGQGPGMAALLKEEGRLEEAKDTLHTALELQPDLHLAQVVLKELGPSAPARSVSQATPAAHFTIKHTAPAKDDGPWLPDPDLAE